MEVLLDGWYQSALADWVRRSRWGYAAINTAHVLGIALLLGSIVPLNLRLLGLWRRIEVAELSRVLVPVAACGLMLAVIAGSLMFISRAPEYAGLNLFRIKLVLVVAGAAHALAVHLGSGFGVAPARQRRIGLVSLLVWPAALVCGRMLAFVEG